MLAERPANPITHPIEARYVRFETSEPTDDILIGTSDGGHTFVQAKRKISPSPQNDSDFASVVDQFVAQFLTSRSGTLVRPWNRSLDANRDRLVLATASNSPETIRVHLRQLLERASALVEGQQASDEDEL